MNLFGILSLWGSSKLQAICAFPLWGSQPFRRLLLLLQMAMALPVCSATIIIIIVIILMAEMTIFYVAGYLRKEERCWLEKRRKWPVI